LLCILLRVKVNELFENYQSLNLNLVMLVVMFRGFESIELLILSCFAEIVGLSHECDVESIKKKRKEKIQGVGFLSFFSLLRRTKGLTNIAIQGTFKVDAKSESLKLGDVFRHELLNQ